MIKSISFFLVSISLLFASCNKADIVNETLLKRYFERKVLNTNFIITLAKDHSTDLTKNYQGYVFVLLKTDFYHGEMTATKNDTTYYGSWSCNEDYSKLDITLPGVPQEFNFLTRSWRFISKKLPELKFAPWGSDEPIVLNMLRK